MVRTVTTQQGNASAQYRQIAWAIGYRFGSDGSAWSCWKMGPHGGICDQWRLMTPIPCNGYLAINLRVGGKQRRFYIHRLILEAFRGPCPEGMECLHDDNDRTNNRIGNIKWGTHVENVEDSRRHGTCQVGIVGARNRSAKLTDPDIVAIRQLSAQGLPYGDIAARYGISKPNVSYIVRRITWAHVA